MKEQIIQSRDMCKGVGSNDEVEFGIFKLKSIREVRVTKRDIGQ